MSFISIEDKLPVIFAKTSLDILTLFHPCNLTPLVSAPDDCLPAYWPQKTGLYKHFHAFFSRFSNECHIYTLYFILINLQGCHSTLLQPSIFARVSLSRSMTRLHSGVHLVFVLYPSMLPLVSCIHISQQHRSSHITATRYCTDHSIFRLRRFHVDHHLPHTASSSEHRTQK